MIKLPEIICDWVTQSVTMPNGNSLNINKLVQRLEAELFIDADKIVAIAPAVNYSVWIAEEEGDLFYPEMSRVSTTGDATFVIGMECLRVLDSIPGSLADFVELTAILEVTVSEIVYNEHGESQRETPYQTLRYPIWLRRSAIATISANVDYEAPGERSIIPDRCLVYMDHHPKGYIMALSVEEMRRLVWNS